MEGIMFPVIDKRETGINLSRIMTMRGITAKNVQDYLNLGCVQSVYPVSYTHLTLPTT